MNNREDKMTYEVTLEKAHEGLTTALEVIRELQKQISTLKEQRDRYKALRDIDSHRIGIATQSIDSLEEELRVMQETYEPERV
jgi:FtsZ-binding cell division protein ZapB